MNEALATTNAELDASGDPKIPTGADDRIFYGDLDENALQALVNSWKAQARFAILERIDELQFPKPETEPIPVSKWPKGRIFTEAFELRWEKLGENYRAVFSSEKIAEEKLPGLSEMKGKISGCSKTTPAYFLWDETNTRLGYRLEYRCVTKTKEKQNVLLRVREYRDARGCLKFWRYLTMEPEL